MSDEDGKLGSQKRTQLWQFSLRTEQCLRRKRKRGPTAEIYYWGDEGVGIKSEGS